MKCPKCGYLGFETVDRCRNCGYDFSLSAHTEPPSELLLHQREGAEAPLADLDLGLPEISHDADGSLDLDRLIGTGPTESAPRMPDRDPVAAAEASGSQASSRPSAAKGSSSARRGLPLFSPSADEVDDTPLITTPRPVRPPLSVRRATPDVPRVRPRATRLRSDDSELNLQLDSSIAETSTGIPGGGAVPSRDAASRVARLAAALVDLLLLGSIDAAVIYLTLAIAGLTVTLANVAVLPIVPAAAFLLLLNG
ncbi:MAG: hypothetical protein ACRD1H_18895, partial [Vicinamibacterales bacterium]